MDKQPPRLIDDPAASAALRADMEHARGEHRGEAAAYDVIVGAAALEAALATSAAAAAGTASSTSATSAAQLGGWTKAVLGVAGASVLVLSGAGLHALLQERMQRAPASSVAAQQPPAAPIALPSPALPSPAVPSAQHAASAEPQKPTPATGEGEARQLARIRALLHAGDATRALALAERGQRERGDSVLWQERQALSVLALLAMDRSAEAEARARTLLSRYPDSPFRAEIEQRLREADAR